MVLKTYWDSIACAQAKRRLGIGANPDALSTCDRVLVGSRQLRYRNRLTVRCGMTWLTGILLASVVLAQTASVTSSRQEQPILLEEGDFVAKSELPREIPPDKDHPIARKLISTEEGEISCEPMPQRILVAHYRAEPTAQFSMKDDRILVAVKQADKFEILKVLQSETVIVEGRLSSDDDFEEKFITIEGMHFLYVRTRVSGSGGIVDHDVYSISSDQKLSIVPFEDVRKSTLLKKGEELRNGDYRFAEGTFTFESRIYKPEDAECCPSLGEFDAEFRLEGKFNQDTHSHAFEPDFRFVVANHKEKHQQLAGSVRIIRKSVGVTSRGLS
jgi:hypothetical protein